MFARYTKKTLLREILIIALALLIMSPFYILLVNALKSTAEMNSGSPIVPPSQPSLDAFGTALTPTNQQSIPVGILNSLIVTCGTLVVVILLGAITAYTITRIPGKLSDFTSLMFVVALILPVQVGMIPLYLGLRSVGLTGSHIGLIILYSGLMLPLAVFLYTGFAREIPREYEEAAQIDGSSPFLTFRTIIFPLLSPATGTVAILVGLAVWNDFAISIIFVNGTSAATLPVMVYGFVGSLMSQWNVIFAAVIIAMIPILAFYAFAQRKFIQGFAGGIKA